MSCPPPPGTVVKVYSEKSGVWHDGRVGGVELPGQMTVHFVRDDTLSVKHVALDSLHVAILHHKYVRPYWRCFSGHTCSEEIDSAIRPGTAVEICSKTSDVSHVGRVSAAEIPDRVTVHFNCNGSVAVNHVKLESVVVLEPEAEADDDAQEEVDPGCPGTGVKRQRSEDYDDAQKEVDPGCPGTGVKRQKSGR